MEKENVEKEEGEIRGSRGVEMVKGIAGNLMGREARRGREDEDREIDREGASEKKR
jgi:hypothetical protein